MNIEEAKSKLLKTPDKYFVAVQFDLDTQNFGAYFLYTEEDEPDEIYLTYEGGVLFSDEGEDGDYDINDFPEELRDLNFISTDCNPSLGDETQYLAYKLFPSLPNPEHIVTKEDYQDFILKLDSIIKSL